MRRILAFFQWHASWWRARIDGIDSMQNSKDGLDYTPDVKEGLTAYAHRQSYIRHNLRKACLKAWKNASTVFSGNGAALIWSDTPVSLPSE